LPKPVGKRSKIEGCSPVVTVASVSSIIVAPRMPVQNEKCRNKRGDSKAREVRAGGKLIAVAKGAGHGGGVGDDRL